MASSPNATLPRERRQRLPARGVIPTFTSRPADTSPQAGIPLLRLLALTAAALVIHGYHLGVEDAEIYVPAVKKFLHPALYPFAPEFFLSHGRLSLFSAIVALTAKISHMPIDWAIFAWYMASLFATLFSCWMLASACFSSQRAVWSSMLMMTAVLTMPATNTGLLLVDPYLTARSISTPLTLIALAAILERRYIWAGVAIGLTATVHIQMVVYLLFLIAVLWLGERRKAIAREPVPALASAGAILPAGFISGPATGNYREALFSRDYFFLYNWHWYHWLGMLAPLAILAWFWRGNVRGTRSPFHRISFALILFGVLSIAVAAVMASSDRFEMFARLQPLRSFHVITFIFILLFAGVMGECLGGKRRWAIAAIFISLATGMFFVNRQTYPHSPQIEFPSASSSNSWINALLWVRRNTPTDAVFAVDSRYFEDDLTDVHGFRAISERSSLADYYKDGGVVSLFPSLADEWKEMSNATYGLNHFTLDRFRVLKAEHPEVSWTVIHGPAPAGMDCPYLQRGYAVCQMPAL
ncbi:MAG TPA: hypothetical protein VLZ50_13525 [Terracidiphilus sp.]|nr:hypothetical protein [Terracidiphilus sp.]